MVTFTEKTWVSVRVRTIQHLESVYYLCWIVPKIDIDILLPFLPSFEFELLGELQSGHLEVVPLVLHNNGVIVDEVDYPLAPHNFVQLFQPTSFQYCFAEIETFHV